MVSPARAREEVARVVRVHAVTQRWAIKALGVKRSTIRYPAPPGHLDYEQRLTAAVIATCVRQNMRHYGYRRITTELVQAGWSVNTKHVQRIMRAEGCCGHRNNARVRHQGCRTTRSPSCPRRG
jgi:putative transposase